MSWREYFWRKRAANPVLGVHTHFIDKLAVANGFVSGVALYPQVFKILSNGDYHSVSLVSFGVILINNLLWGLYAFHRGLISLLIASVLNVVAAGILLMAFMAV